MFDQRVDDDEQSPYADDAQSNGNQGLDQLAGEWAEAREGRFGSEQAQAQPDEDDNDRGNYKVANYRHGAALLLSPRFQCL
jgi:hypothetical protein